MNRPLLAGPFCLSTWHCPPDPRTARQVKIWPFSRVWGPSEERGQLAIPHTAGHSKGTYLDESTHIRQRQAIPQHRLHKHPQREDVQPTHDRITVPRPPQSQRLTPQPPLLLLQLPQLLFLRLAPAICELHLPRRPPLLSTLVHKLGAVLLEARHGVELELIVLRQQLRGAGDDHGTYLLVALEEVLGERGGDGDEVLLQVFGVVGFDEGVRIDDGVEGFLREVARLRALEGGEVGLARVVLVELLLDVVVDGGEVFLQAVDQLADGLVGAVFDFVPVERLQVVLYRACVSNTSMAIRYYSFEGWIVRTIIDDLLLLQLLFVSLEQRP